MSLWTVQWRDFINQSSYKHLLKDKDISNDKFWRDYRIYDEVLKHSGYPGEILQRVSSLISPGSVILDIGAGTGAFALPLAEKAGKVIALDPSTYQLGILNEKAHEKGLGNIKTITKEWASVDLQELGEVDYSLAAYSLFDEDIEGFLRRIMECSKKGAFIIFRAGEIDPLNDFAYGKRPSADYLCLQKILEEMGYHFRAEVFSREYRLPLKCVFHQFRFSEKSREEITNFLQDAGRLTSEENGLMASFSNKDALLYYLS